MGLPGNIELTETPVGKPSRKQKDRLAAVSPKSDQVYLLALMAEANSKLERLLTQGTNSALHLLGNFNNWRLRF